MPEIDPDEILREMGITRWVLRATDSNSESDLKPDPGPDPRQSIVPRAGEMDRVAPATKRVEQAVRPAQRERTVLVDSKPAEAKSRPVEQLEVASTLATLSKQVSACTQCELAQSRSQTVFGSGPDQADWMFIGEAPGQQEDRQGKPFVGRAGQLLTQMVLALGTTRDAVYIANTLKCRPPNNRDPLPEELQACEAFLLQQIKLVKPKVLVALGRTSAQALLKSDQPLGRMRGEVYRYGPEKLPLVVTYHPAYLLRKPADKSKAWADLLLAHSQLAQ